MTHNDFVKAVAKKSGESQATVQAVLEAAFKDVAPARIKRGDKISIPGFGTFNRRSNKARTGRNPQTGRSMKIKASKGCSFSQSSVLKGKLNK
jgi:DNA-binding protein HU-beta